MKGFAIYIEVIVVVGGADAVGILALQSKVTGEKKAFSIPERLGVGGVGGEFVLCELFDVGMGVYADGVVRVGGQDGGGMGGGWSKRRSARGERG